MAQQLPQENSLQGVSVVIPTYNYGHFLAEAISGVLAQTHCKLEVIVVDDGSTDNTAEIVEPLARADARLKYIHKKNAGLPAARNTGIAAAQFDLVAFLDADDQWTPGFLELAVRTFMRLPKEFAVVACSIVFVDLKGVPFPVKCLVSCEAAEVTCRELILKTRFTPSSVVARRSALLDCGMFDESLRSSEDRDMWIRLASRYRVFVNSERNVLIRRHSGSMSAHADRMKTNGLRVLRKSYRQKLVPRKAVIFWLRAFSFHLFQTAWMYRNEGRRGKAVLDMTLSILLWPCFLKSKTLNEPPLFRLRGLIRFGREMLTHNSA